MNPRRCTESDYIEFLLAAQTAFGCVEAANSQPERLKSTAHDAYTRLLTRRPLDPEALWNEAQAVLGGVPKGGLLVLDDTTLDKPYSQKIDLVSRHWSGKHGRVVTGINLLSLVWTQIQNNNSSHNNSSHNNSSHNNSSHNNSSSTELPMPPVLPLDFRVYDVNADANGQHFTKNDHFRAMISQAKARGLQPACVAFDSWYAGLENLKHLRQEGFAFLTRLKSNRQVNPDKSGLVEVRALVVPMEGLVVQLRGFGLVRLFVKPDSQGQNEYWASSNTAMKPETFEQTARACWGIESYHRGLKQCCGVERAQVRSATGQKNHLLLCLRAFLRLEAHRLQTGLSWYAAKLSLVREAIRMARTHTTWRLNPTA